MRHPQNLCLCQCQCQCRRGKRAGPGSKGFPGLIFSGSLTRPARPALDSGGGRPLQKSRKKKGKREKKGERRGRFVSWFAIICYFLFVYFYYCYYPSAEPYDSSGGQKGKRQDRASQRQKATNGRSGYSRVRRFHCLIVR